MFKEERKDPIFEWNMIGDVKLGRPNLGELVPVDVYRLMQFTLRDELICKFGVQCADEVFFNAGKKAGIEFVKNIVRKRDSLNEFIESMQATLRDLKIGILRVEKVNMDSLELTLTVAEDLDCSGMPMIDEEICVYDEGFIAGMLLEQTGIHFSVNEIDCWCSGDRVCRFDIKPELEA